MQASKIQPEQVYAIKHDDRLVRFYVKAVVTISDSHTKVYLAGRRTCSDSGDGANQRAIRRTKPKKHETRLEGGPLSRRTGEHQ